MKLVDAHRAQLIDSRFFLFTEAGEAPRWRFNYSAWKHDPHPDILLLGAYQHPNTGNNLVGGINLNYLSQEQRNDLAKVLPQIMQAGNLYSRYHTGKQVLPDVFDNFYRTYNANYIRGVEQDTLYPKYGMLQAAQDHVKKSIANLFKTRAQKAADAEPEYPDDLQGMDDMLDNVVLNLGKREQAKVQAQEPPDTPEMAAARQAFQQYKLDRARSMMDVERQQDEPLFQAAQDYQQQQLQQGQVAPQAVRPQPRGTVQPQHQATQPTPAPTPQPEEPAPQEMAQMIEKERQENQQELMDPANDVDLDPRRPRNESVVYYSVKDRRYIVEDIYIGGA